MKRYKFNLKRWLWRNNGHGNFVVIKGPIRRGKTYLASIFCRQAIGWGFKVISNIRFEPEALEKYRGKLFYMTSDRDLFNAYIENEGPFLVVWDDAQVYGMSSTKTTNKKGKKITDLSLFIGKFEMSAIFIEHLNYIPQFIKNMQPMYIYKLDRNSFYVPQPPTRYIEDEREIRQRCVRIQISDKNKPIPYQTLKIPSFDITLPLDDLWSYLAAYETKSSDLREGVKRFLENLEQKEEDERLKKLTWEELWRAIQYKRPGTRPREKLYNVFPHDVIYDNGF